MDFIFETILNVSLGLGTTIGFFIAFAISALLISLVVAVAWVLVQFIGVLVLIPIHFFRSKKSRRKG